MVLGITVCLGTRFECVDIDNHRGKVFSFGLSVSDYGKVNKRLLSELSCDNGAK